MKDVSICVQIMNLSGNFGLLYLCSSELVLWFLEYRYMNVHAFPLYEINT